MLETLLRHRVRFVLIGGIAARLRGSPTMTRDLDICYARDSDNLAALAAALQELGARLRGVKEDVPFRLDARSLRLGDRFTFRTAFGDLDCLGTPTGTLGYESLARNADEVDIDGSTVKVVALDDLIRMKAAAGRPKDRIEIEVLGALREEIGKRRRPRK